jgi:predicted ATPase/DNA-binding winged helix-turn-helix (wHTH) protein
MTAQTRDVLSFGNFSLVPSERLLTRGGVTLQLGARTLDILMALVSRPNEAVSKRDLIAQVWPDVIVGEGSLRFHMASLRKALGDGKNGARYITTLAGRGYCFVAPISRSSEWPRAPAAEAADAPRTNLPSRPSRMVGRAAAVLMLSTQLAASRFVTIVGTGGVGKTTVAVAVGHEQVESFAGAVHFVDLGTLGDPNLVATSLASMLGLSFQSQDPTPSLMAFLRDKRILLIFDNCEHVIEAAATLAVRIFQNAPQVHILATSREVLRAEGEQVYRLAPLLVPPDDPGLTAAAALTFPATQLFLERAAVSGARLDLSDANAATVASICRKLDGVALAIELAAGRVAAYGLQQTAALLEERLSLLWVGQRTAPPRQQTLKATLDWSYGLLSELERVVLRRLAVFVGQFTIDAALAVVTSATVDQALVFGAIDSLVAKSMVASRPVGAMMRYRLLETTRAYALEVGVEDSELAGLAARHAAYYRGWLEESGAEWPTLSSAAERAPYLAALGNVRAALEWGFGPHGNAEVGVGLAAAAARVFLAMSLLTESARWSERAILALDGTMRGGPDEMLLQAALGLSSMFTRGSSDAARAALSRSLAIAEERDDPLNQLQLLGLLHMFHHRAGDFKTALHYAKRCSAMSGTVADPASAALAHSLLGRSLRHAGDLGGARRELEAALQQGRDVPRSGGPYLGFDHYNYAGVALARTLWLQGHPTQAMERIRQTVEDAVSLDHPGTLSIALAWAVFLSLWSGNLESAEEHMDWFITHADAHSLKPYLAVGRGFKAELALRRGDIKGGVEALQRCLGELHALRYELLTTEFSLSIAQGLAATGRQAEALELIDETIRLVEGNGDLAHMPELLRVKGGIVLSMPQPRPDEAETHLTQSLEWSRRQAARAWELRAAIDLAALWARHDRRDEARALLQPVYERFEEGSDTADLKAAERLLASLAEPRLI